MAHAHSHAHAHASAREGARHRLAQVMAITVGLMLVETAGGLLTGSLTLLADAAHMLSDVAAVGLALFALWFGARPSPPHRTYGYYRAEIIAALVNALLLVLVIVLVVREAVQRVHQPEEIRVVPMFFVGLLGFLGNLASMRILHRHAGAHLTVRGAYLEVMADMLASVGVLLAAALTGLLGWRHADPVISLGIALFILPRIWHLLREATDVLMETAPRGMKIEAVRQAILEREGVVAVHDLHIWTISPGRTMLSAHVVGRAGSDRDALILLVNRTLRERFGIGHTTLQVEGEGAPAYGSEDPAEACDSCMPDDVPASPGRAPEAPRRREN